MLSEKEKKKISKFLSLVLRHQPELIGIRLNSEGWTEVSLLLEKINASGTSLNLDQLKDIVQTNEKKRFAFSTDLQRIRASQGHSVEVDLGYQPQKPPEILFHGTAEKNIISIRHSGLQKMDRHHVHLSSDRETAFRVGQRYGKPFIFIVNSGKMAEDGLIFYKSENGVWLTDHVAPQYLQET